MKVNMSFRGEQENIPMNLATGNDRLALGFGVSQSAGVGLPPGGATGQFLRKNSNTDYDAGWQDLEIEIDDPSVIFQFDLEAEDYSSLLNITVTNGPTKAEVLARADELLDKSNSIHAIATLAGGTERSYDIPLSVFKIGLDSYAEFHGMVDGGYDLSIRTSGNGWIARFFNATDTISSEVGGVLDITGDIDQLSTEDKSSLVAAINEVAGQSGLPSGGVNGDIIVKSNGAAAWVAPASSVEEDNTLPITSAAVYTTVGNINALLATI